MHSLVIEGVDVLPLEAAKKTAVRLFFALQQAENGIRMNARSERAIGMLLVVEPLRLFLQALG
jgi:hypothetical protein